MFYFFSTNNKIKTIYLFKMEGILSSVRGIIPTQFLDFSLFNFNITATNLAEYVDI